MAKNVLLLSTNQYKLNTALIILTGAILLSGCASNNISADDPIVVNTMEENSISSDIPEPETDLDETFKQMQVQNQLQNDAIIDNMWYETVYQIHFHEKGQGDNKWSATRIFCDGTETTDGSHFIHVGDEIDTNKGIYVVIEKIDKPPYDVSITDAGDYISPDWILDKYDYIQVQEYEAVAKIQYIQHLEQFIRQAVQ